MGPSHLFCNILSRSQQSTRRVPPKTFKTIACNTQMQQTARGCPPKPPNKKIRGNVWWRAATAVRVHSPKPIFFAHVPSNSLHLSRNEETIRRMPQNHQSHSMSNSNVANCSEDAPTKKTKTENHRQCQQWLPATRHCLGFLVCLVFWGTLRAVCYISVLHAMVLLVFWGTLRVVCHFLAKCANQMGGAQKTIKLLRCAAFAQQVQIEQHYPYPLILGWACSAGARRCTPMYYTLLRLYPQASNLQYTLLRLCPYGGHLYYTFLRLYPHYSTSYQTVLK